jgi:CRISPR/Cas system CMR-associated protein Cmr5 small subunit
MPSTNIDQLRARRAWASVTSVAENDRKQYAKEAQALPGCIAINGLIPALVHLSLGKTPQATRLWAHMEAWLCLPECPVKCSSSTAVPPEPIEVRLTRVSPTVLRQATEESLRFAVWLKRWAQAYTPDDTAAASVDPAASPNPHAPPPSKGVANA